MLRKEISKMAKLLRDIYPTRRFDGKTYRYYVARAHRDDIKRDKRALRNAGYSARVLTLPYVGPGLGRYVVFRRK